MERVTYVWKNQTFSILKWYLVRMCTSWLCPFNLHLKPILKHMFTSRPSSLAHKLLMLMFMLASLVRTGQVFSTLLVPARTTGHNHTPPLNLFRAFPCAPPYALSIFWWSPLLLLSWSPSHGNYPFIEHPQDMHVQHFWICSISVRISIATRKIQCRSCDWNSLISASKMLLAPII